MSEPHAQSGSAHKGGFSPTPQINMATTNPNRLCGDPRLSSTEGSAFPWILEHLLTYPGSYEIPLRTMYTLNSAPRAQPLPHQLNNPGTPSLSNGSSVGSSPASPRFPPEYQQQLTSQTATDHFKSCLMEQISNLPAQPFSLPPVFITQFVRRCFTEDICQVDFTQALTALDYLKDLENRRKRELTATLQRLGVDKATFGRQGEEANKQYKGVREWVLSMEEKERRVEALYTQVYVGLRRWTLINEMRLDPFSKANCIAMLNTLYPPATATPPTQQLTTTILAAQRHQFFRYIVAVEKNGKGVLANLENQFRGPQDENGWPAIREIVDKYLRTANGVIEECLAVTDRDAFGRSEEEKLYTSRRADSGISIASTDRPTTSSSTADRPPFNDYKPLPPSPRPEGHLTSRKTGSTLERIAREIRRIKSRSDNIVNTTTANRKRDSKDESDRDDSKVKALRKMKSTSAIGRGFSSVSSSRAAHSRSGSGDSEYKMPEIDEVQRQRMIWEANREKENRMPRRGTEGMRA